jgi:putative photosynthetic complex assembly protein
MPASTLPPERPIPVAILVGGGAVMAISLMAVASVRHGWAPHQPMPTAAVAASFDFRAAPGPDGSERLLAARDGREVARLYPKTDDFLPTLIDKLAQERALKGRAAGAPYRLVRWSDGRASLTDPITGRDLHLESFGAGNQAAALALIKQGQGK